MSNLEEQIKHAAEKAILKILADGSWVSLDYGQRVKIGNDFLQDVWKLVDVEKLKDQLARRLEQELADRLINHMAAELATDVKSILSVAERREALRAVVRENFDRIMKH